MSKNNNHLIETDLIAQNKTDYKLANEMKAWVLEINQNVVNIELIRHILPEKDLKNLLFGFH